jgi:uncharacterized ferritin-like protein (DUF455 family)
LKIQVSTLRERAYVALLTQDAQEKTKLVKRLLCQDDDAIYARVARKIDSNVPGRPAKPSLVSPRELKHRALASPGGRAILFHALAHIEFNAINLALDALWRFDEMPDAFAFDWAHVAMEEAHHFQLLCAHLATLNQGYGDFPAHDGLWEMAEKTKGDVLARLALVPRTLEARGLDVSPTIRDKLSQAGDHDGAKILDVILNDEIGHVAIGNKWYRFCCAARELDPLVAYEALAVHYRAPLPRGPFNGEARLRAGFEPAELAALERAANVAKTFVSA